MTAVVVIGDADPALDVAVTGWATDATALAEVLAGIDGDVVLLDQDLNCSGPYPFDDVRADGASRVLIAPGGSAPVRIASKVIASAGTSQAPLADATDAAVGALRVSAQDRGALTAALAQVGVGPAGRLWEQLLSILVMRGVRIQPVYAEPFEVGKVVAPTPNPISLQAQRCARADDGWLSERTVRRMSRGITPLAVRLGLAPTTVTVLSLIVGAGAVGTALLGTWWGYLLTSVLMVLSLVLDCVDGEVARWTHRYSRGGAWLDAVGDRVKEYAVWFALGVSLGSRQVWLLILASLVLYTTKHFLDYGWSLRYPPWQLQPIAVSPVPDPWKAAGAVPPSVRPPSWRRVLGMPIAERWLLLAVLLPIAGVRWTFVVLTALGMISLAYTVLTRIRWSHKPIDESLRPELAAITDPGPLLLALTVARVGWAPAAALGWVVAVAGVRWWPVALLFALGLYAVAYGPGPRGRLGWMSPAVARGTEMTVMLALVWAEAGPATYALLAAAAWRHYDVIYRIRNQGVVPGKVAWVLLLGTEGRIIVAALLLTLLGVTAWYWMALYLAVVAVGDSLWSWFGRSD